MKLVPAIRSLLLGLAVLGLLAAPWARPAIAMPMAMHHAPATDAAMPDSAGMDMAGMPCCPDKAPVSDCGKDCPLMVMCFAQTFQAGPSAAALPMPFTVADVIVPADDAEADSLAHGPPPRPPKA